MKVAIGADANAFHLKEELKNFLIQSGYDVLDYGVGSDEDIDYPNIALKVAQGILSNKAEKGILLCGTGIGMALAANKVNGIRAAQVSDVYSAERAELSNKAQIITMGSKILGFENAKIITLAFLKAKFTLEGTGKNSARKVEKIMSIEQGKLN